METTPNPYTRTASRCDGEPYSEGAVGAAMRAMDTAQDLVDLVAMTGTSDEIEKFMQAAWAARDAATQAFIASCGLTAPAVRPAPEPAPAARLGLCLVNRQGSEILTDITLEMIEDAAIQGETVIARKVGV